MGQRRRFSAFVTKDSNCASAIGHSLQFARGFLDGHELDSRMKVKLAILVEELVTNALRHGGKSQDIAVTLVLSAGQDSVHLEITDNGPAFDPLSVPPITGPDPITGGGIGLAILKAWGENAVYSRKTDGNVLSLTLR